MEWMAVDAVDAVDAMDAVVAVAAADAGLGWKNPGFARVPCAA